MSTSIHTQDIKEARIQRRVYDQWSTLRLSAFNSKGMEFSITLEGGGYSNDHKPIPVIWEAPDFVEAAEKSEMTTPRELFRVTHLNQPEAKELTEIRELFKATIPDAEFVKAVFEIVFGPSAGDSVASSSPEPTPDPLPDDEIPF